MAFRQVHVAGNRSLLVVYPSGIHLVLHLLSYNDRNTRRYDRLNSVR